MQRTKIKKRRRRRKRRKRRMSMERRCHMNRCLCSQMVYWSLGKHVASVPCVPTHIDGAKRLLSAALGWHTATTALKAEQQR